MASFSARLGEDLVDGRRAPSHEHQCDRSLRSCCAPSQLKKWQTADSDGVEQCCCQPTAVWIRGAVEDLWLIHSARNEGPGESAWTAISRHAARVGDRATVGRSALIKPGGLRVRIVLCVSGAYVVAVRFCMLGRPRCMAQTLFSPVAAAKRCKWRLEEEMGLRVRRLWRARGSH